MKKLVFIVSIFFANTTSFATDSQTGNLAKRKLASKGEFGCTVAGDVQGLNEGMKTWCDTKLPFSVTPMNDKNTPGFLFCCTAK